MYERDYLFDTAEKSRVPELIRISISLISFDLYEGKVSNHLESPPAAISLTFQKNWVESSLERTVFHNRIQNCELLGFQDGRQGRTLYNLQSTGRIHLIELLSLTI